LQFSLKNLSPEMIMNHLKFILEQEKIEFEEEALWQIGRAAKGSVRDALTLLDQAISFCNGKLTDAEISSFLGTIDQNILYQLVDALIAEDAQAILSLITKVSEQAPDFASILEALLSYLHRVAVAQVVPEGLDNSQGDKKQILEHAAAMPAENVQLYYQMALKGREDLPLAVDDRSGIEMTLLRMLAFTPKGVPSKPERVLATTNNAELVSTQDAGSRSEKASSESEVQVEKKKNLETIEVKAQADPDNTSGTETTSTEAHSEKAKPEKESDSTVHRLSEHESSEEKLSLSTLKPEQWIPLFYNLNLTGITRSIAAHCLLLGVRENIITLALDASHSKILNEGHQEQIEKAMSDYFSTRISLEISQEELDSELETPVAYRLRKQQERQHIAEEVFKNDDYVKSIMERFEGSILPDSIEPLTPEDY
jgi:DNA polymerase III subunit gamma/tau